MASRDTQQEESWNSIHRSEASEDPSNEEIGYPEDTSIGGDDEDEESPLISPTLATFGDVQRVLHPLQATADRVGRQVEQFAENLDRYSTRRPQQQVSKNKDCRHVLPFIHAYQKTALETVKHLRVLHAPDAKRRSTSTAGSKIASHSCNARSTSGQRSVAKSKKDGPSLTTIEDLDRWVQERETWDLFSSMIQLDFPVPDMEGTQSNNSDLHRPTKGTELYSYSTDKDVWNEFLATQDLAWERNTVVKWLQRTADQSGADIEQVIEELESNAGRGSGIVAHSWLYTREAIKGQKRLRSWPRALEPEDPGLDSSLMDTKKRVSLVTHLDPDALTRQTPRELEEQDVFFEQAIWLACWEMLRRGKSWRYIQEWCAERGEHWRSAVLHPCLQYARTQPILDSDWVTQYLWRKTCAVASKDGGVNEYEKAVYGALSGYLPSVQKISDSWLDQLFAYYNSYLINSFERFLRSTFGNRIPPRLSDKDGLFGFSTLGNQRAFSGNQLVEKLRLSDNTRKEAMEPLRMLQGSLIARNLDDFIFKHGVKLSQLANAEEKSKIMPSMSRALIEGSTVAPISMQDFDVLRIITHMIFIYKDMGHDFGDGERAYAAENFVVAYVDYLSKAGKQQLLPIYASRLSHERSIICLARQLPRVREDKERGILMSLMKRMSMDIPGVLQAQLKMIVEDSPPDHVYLADYPPLSLLEPNESSATKIPPVAKHFFGEKVSEDHYDLIHSFEWYKLLEGHWRQTMALGVMIYKYLLRCQSLAAGIFMSQRIPFSDISTRKTPAIVGHAIDLSQNDRLCNEADGESVWSTGYSAKSRRRDQGQSGPSDEQAKLDLLLNQATSFIDLENLFVALHAIKEWVHWAEKVGQTSRRTTGSELRSQVSAFKGVFKAVEAAMQPLLRGWLQSPRHEEEANEFRQIRLACLPELVVAYNSILNYSAYFAGRDVLKTSMDLAALVAEEGSDLAACLMETGRMPELVDSFAIVAKSMIAAEAKRPGEKQKDGKTLGLFSAKRAAGANEA